MKKLLFFLALLLLPATTHATESIIQEGNAASDGATFSFVSLPQVGDLIVVFEYTFPFVNPPHDNQVGNTYTQQILKVDPGGSNTVAIYTSKVVGASGTFTLSVTSDVHAMIEAYDIRGWDGTTVLDGATTTVANTTTTNPQTSSLAPNVTTTMDDSIFLLGSIDESNTAHTFSATVGGTAAVSDFLDPVFSAETAFHLAPGSAGTRTIQFTNNGTTGDTEAVVGLAIKGTVSSAAATVGANPFLVDAFWLF